MEKIRVLIIDEHPAVCQALAARLRAVNSIEVVGALSVYHDALEFLCSARPDVILLDVIDKMGSSNEAMLAILRLVAGGQAGVIVLTSYVDEIERVGVMQAGARRYLLKDIDTVRLITEIEAVAQESSVRLPLIPTGERAANNSRLH